MFDEFSNEIKEFNKQLRQILFNQAMIMDALEPTLSDEDKKKNLRFAMIKTAKVYGVKMDGDEYENENS